MATCKECLHYNACLLMVERATNYSSIFEVMYANCWYRAFADVCAQFKDKTRYIDAEAFEKVLCERCNKEFSESPCEPSECIVLDTLRNAKIDGETQSPHWSEFVIQQIYEILEKGRGEG